MKKIILIVATFCYTTILNAQTGIGTTTPDASAKLEVSSTNKGFLPPRVSLTATNVASPITSPANGLMVFNTVIAGSSPFQVVPGYYYWDATGLQWVSLSTTVGNVQNQGVFRSTSNTTGGAVISTWNSRFNNIASGDLTVTSNTTFALSNGIYKVEWALPYQSSSTYNLMQLQELKSGTWSVFLNDGGFANIGNGGNTDWGGGTFATDIMDCSSSTRTFKFINADGGRSLYYGASLIITKLNSSTTTSTTADNLGNHVATKNLLLNGYYLSNDGGDEGIKIDNNGNVGIGNATPSAKLHVKSNGATFRLEGTDHVYMELFPQGATTRHAYFGYPSANSTQLSLVNERADGTLGFGTNSTVNMVLNKSGDLGIGTASPAAKLHLYDNANTGWWPGLWLDGNRAANGTQIIMKNNNDVEWHIDNHGSASTAPNSLNLWNSSANTNVFNLATNGQLDLTTTSPTSLKITANTTDNNGMILLNANTNQNWANGWHEFIMFQNQGTTIGHITQTNASTIAYNTTSDYRLKTDLKNYSGLDLVNKIKTYDFAWKLDSSRMYGVMAHELQAVLPYAVTGNKDATDKDGKIIPQAVDYSKLTPVLVKAVQEQEVKITEQNNRINQLIIEKEQLNKRLLDLEILINSLIKK